MEEDARKAKKSSQSEANKKRCRRCQVAGREDTSGKVERK